jgi:hypothetical protein
VANANTPFGLQPVRGGGGYAWNAQGTLYRVPSTNNNAMYLGDPVIAAAGADTNGVPNCDIAGGTDTLRGVIVGILPVYPGVSIQGTPLSLENMNIPATKTHDYYVVVDDDPTSIFCIQDDGITTAKLVAASANLNFSLTITAGATVQSASATVILSSSFATTSSLNMKALGLAQIPNNTFGAYAKWLCRINEHQLGQPTAGV